MTNRRWILAATLLLAVHGSEAPAEVYFGDPHAHSKFSDPDDVGEATPADFFRIARDLVGLDFAALSDHDAFLTTEEWGILRATTASFDLPGRFVTLPAVEWTHRWHMNMYVQDDDEPLCDSPDLKCPEADEFHAFYGPLVRAGEAAGHVNHPIGIFAVDWRSVDDTITTNVEMYNVASSGSGSASEEFGFGGVLWALRAGYHVGFVGVSDDHHVDDPEPLIGRGLTGCHADALDRRSLLEAFRARRCYPTTGERILVDLDVGETPMGGEVEAPIGTRLPVDVRVTGTAGPIRIELVQSGEVVDRVRCADPACGLLGEVTVRHPSDFVYARIFQGESDRAWSTPVWLRGRCATGGLCLASRLASGSEDADDCLSEWLFPTKGDGAVHRRAASRIECHDGDPRCDLDDETGQCTVAVGVCFGGLAAPRATCAPGEVDAWSVVLPTDDAATGSPSFEIRRTLESIHRAAQTSADESTCSPLSHFSVDLGRHVLAIEARSGDRRDTDELTIDCRSARRRVRRLPVRPNG